MASLRVLFVDDDPARFLRLRALVADAGALASIRWRRAAAAVTDDDLAWAEIVFLDHDMCEAGDDPASPCPNVPLTSSSLVLPACRCPTGVDVARRVTQLVPVPRAVVQSVNVVGAQAIAGVLADAGGRVVLAPVTTWRGWNPAQPWRAMVGE